MNPFLALKNILNDLFNSKPDYIEALEKEVKKLKANQNINNEIINKLDNKNKELEERIIDLKFENEKKDREGLKKMIFSRFYCSECDKYILVEDYAEEIRSSKCNVCDNNLKWLGYSNIRITKK